MKHTFRATLRHAFVKPPLSTRSAAPGEPSATHREDVGLKRVLPLPSRRSSTRMTSTAIVALLAAPLLASGLVAASASNDHPFRDPDLPLDERIDDLLGRLTLDEKLGFLHQSQLPIPRLGVPYFKAGTEALHGVAWSNDLDNNWGQVLATDATVFPQAVGLASTWDPDLINDVGSAVGDELRAHNTLDPQLWGLQAWVPVVDPLRDPRWGRNEEGYSEDPLLAGEIGTAYGSGLSGDDPLYLKVAPVIKHYFGYNKEADRSVSSSNLPPRIRKEYSQAPFRSVISADAATGVMASYNLVNGRPTHVDPSINEDIRSWTDKDLYNVSDAWGPHAVTQAQFYFDEEDEAYAAILKAGLDGFTVDESDPSAMKATLHSALDKGYITEADVDTAVRHVLSIRFRLGHFDPDGGPYADIGPEVLNSAEHQALNRRTAADAMVLLDNGADILPLDPDQTSSVAVIGPLHDMVFTDFYGGSMPYEVTPLDGIAERLGGAADVTGVEGLDRVTLKDSATGRYLTATGTDPADLVVASDASPSVASQWDVNDWMADYSTLRNAENGKYLSGAFGPYTTSSDEPSGWYVQQQFRFEEQPDGTVLIQYVGYETNESWWWIPEHYVTVAPDGTVGTGSKADAARFVPEVVSDGVDAAVAAAGQADAAVVVVGSHPFVYGRENHDRTDLALGRSQQELVDAVTAANPNTVVVLETSYPTTFDNQPETLLWTTHAGSETGNAVADVVFGDENPAGRLTQTWYAGVDDLPSIDDFDIVKSGWTYMYYDGVPLYPFGHGLSYSTFDYSNLKTSGSSVGGDGAIRVSVDVTNTGDAAGDEVVQLYSRQLSSRDATADKQLRAFERVSLAPGETKTVRLELDASDLARWDVTRDRWVVESSEYELLVGSSSADIRQQATVRVKGETIPARNLSKPTRAENFDDYAGVLLVDESKERGTAVSAEGDGWIKFGDTKLRANDSTFTARVSNASDENGSIQVRLGSPTGELIGTAEVTSTGDVYEYATTTASLSGSRGLHDVYLVFDGDFRVADFTIG